MGPTSSKDTAIDWKYTVIQRGSNKQIWKSIKGQQLCIIECKDGIFCLEQLADIKESNPVLVASS